MLIYKNKLKIFKINYNANLKIFLKSLILILITLLKLTF